MLNAVGWKYFERSDGFKCFRRKLIAMIIFLDWEIFRNNMVLMGWLLKQKMEEIVCYRIDWALPKSHHLWHLCFNVPNSLQWRHNDHDNVLNHQPRGCLLNRLFRRRSKKTSKLRITGLCVGTSPGPVNSPHKGPVTRKMFPFDDVIMSVTNGMFSTPPWAINSDQAHVHL